MRVVISQPMFFPWVGMFEQIRLANIYVHYSDVQYSKGSFVNRVQIKTPMGVRWLTVPLQRFTLGQRIDQIQIAKSDWRSKHLELLKQSYRRAPYMNDMFNLVEQVYSHNYLTIDELSRASLDAVCHYYQLNPACRFLNARDLAINGKGSQRVLDIVQALGGTVYITGHGAKNYLDHARFEAAGVRVEYMNYQCKPYPQMHGAFTPYVSILDLIANMGQAGREYICSDTLYWRDFLNGST